MKLSREARRQSRQLFELALVDARLDVPRLRSIFDGVAARKPRQYVQILKELTRLVRLELSRHHALIESARPLDAAQSEQFASALRARFGDITTAFRSNPALIGGVRVQLGSDVWDGSVRARLQAVKQLL